MCLLCCRIQRLKIDEKKKKQYDIITYETWCDVNQQLQARFDRDQKPAILQRLVYNSVGGIKCWRGGMVRKATRNMIDFSNDTNGEFVLVYGAPFKNNVGGLKVCLFVSGLSVCE